MLGKLLFEAILLDLSEALSLFYFQLQSLHKFQLDESQVTDTGKFRFLDALLPAIKEKVRLY